MKLKLIAAAVALLASGSSFAFISGPDDGVANGIEAVPSEMFMTVWQASGTGTGTVNRSFTYDMGVSVADMKANKGTDLFINKVISGSSDWTNFLAAGASTSFQYNVSGGERADVAKNYLLQTYAASTVTTKTNLQLSNGLDAIQQYVGANNATGTHAAGPDGVSFNTSGDAYFMTNNSVTWIGSTGANSVAVGTAAMFGEMYQNGANPGTNATNSIYAGKMLLSQSGSTYSLQYQVPAGVVPVTPVPEASTYAMLLGGLGAIGFMARRRKPV